MRKTSIIVALLLLFSSGFLSAQDEMFKALFMYNFTKDIQWPDAYSSGDFVIGVLGSSGIATELDKIAEKKKVGLQTIVVKRINSTAEIGKCNIVYVASAKATSLAPVLATVKGKPTLVISDKPGQAKEGSCINFVMVDGKQKFEINPKAISESGLKITTFLINLGIKVE